MKKTYSLHGKYYGKYSEGYFKWIGETFPDQVHRLDLMGEKTTPSSQLVLSQLYFSAFHEILYSILTEEVS